MSPFRIARDARDLYRELVDLLVIEDDGEEASYEIAVSAQRFSRNAQAAVDDKLNFSATLMRAGEVEAANRLLKEFHDDVREEEVALIERVNEVKAAEAVRRTGVTRVRLARMLAAAMVGASLLSFSAAGMALAGLVRDRAAEIEQAQVAARGSSPYDRVFGTRIASVVDRKNTLRHVDIGRLRLLLSASELRTITKLAGGSVDESGLQELMHLLPRPLAAKVQQALVAVSDAVADAEETVKDADIPAELRVQRRKDKKNAEAKQSDEQPSPQPSESNDQDPQDDDGGLPQQEPEDEETPQEDDEGRHEDEDGNLPRLFDQGE